MTGFDADLLAEWRDCREMAAAFLDAGLPEFASPWLMRAARIQFDLRKRGIV